MPVERIARIGELVTGTASEGAVLTALGLGSCIGLAIVDGRVAGLAHILLPGGEPSGGDEPAKRADTAVPALVEALVKLGTARSRMEAVIVGGAQMFSFGGGEIGARNEQAVRAALEALRIPLLAAATGGQSGRTVKVDAAQGLVEVKAPGGERTVLHHCARARRRVAA